MKMSDVIKRCNAAMPQSYSTKESYGPIEIEDLEADVQRILYCVTLSPQVKEYAVAHKYDLVIAHHPFTQGFPHLVYHTALDCCTGGLNDMFANELRLDINKRTNIKRELGVAGPLPEPIYFWELVNRLKAFCGAADGQLFARYGKWTSIKSVAICTGSGGSINEDALATGADCYIIGEAAKSAEKMGFTSVIELGHSNSEWIGVKLLRDIFLKTGVSVDLAPVALDICGREYYRNGKPEYYADKTGVTKRPPFSTRKENALYTR